MTSLPLLLLAAVWLGVQIEGPSTPLTLDIRVFQGATEVTRESTVAIYRNGERTRGRRLPLVETGARRVALRTGAYDVQLLQEQDGKVNAVAWSTLRLHVDYPLEGQPHLEVLNFDQTHGAIQVRPRGHQTTGTPTWSARLVTKDGSEVATGVTGPGYQVLVAPAGVYDVVVVGPGTPERLLDVEIKPNLTFVKTF